MLNSTDRMAREKSHRESAIKAAQRSEEASIVLGLRGALAPNEQLLSFVRGVIAGGIKGRLNLGPEAFVAPFVNIGLTDNRLILQHLLGESGKTGEILPHYFPLSEIQSITFSDIETFGADPAARLIVTLVSGLSFRIRVKGAGNAAGARTVVEVFHSMTSVSRRSSSSMHRSCSSCNHPLDQPTRFCPYCGSAIESASAAEPELTTLAGEPEVEAVAAEPEIEAIEVLPEIETVELLPEIEAVEPLPEIEAVEPLPEIEAVDPLPEIEAVAATPELEAIEPEPAEVEPEIAGLPAIAVNPAGWFQEEASLPSTYSDNIGIVTPDLEVEVNPVSVGYSYLFDEAAPSVNVEGSQSPAEPIAEQEAEVDPIVEPIISAEADITVGVSDSSDAPSPAAVAAPDAGVETRNIEIPPLQLSVHFHVQHPMVQFNQVVTGKDPDEVVANLKAKVILELKFPFKLAVMRMSALDFAREIVNKYNQTEHKDLPRPASCQEFLVLAQSIGYATLQTS